MKKEYRWHYYGVKYLPALCTALFAIAAILLLIFPEKREQLLDYVDIFSSLSFAAGILLFIASFAMKFCWVHRLHIIYLVIATYFIAKPGSEWLLASFGIILLLFTLYVIFIRKHCEKPNQNEVVEESPVAKSPKRVTRRPTSSENASNPPKTKAGRKEKNDQSLPLR